MAEANAGPPPVPEGVKKLTIAEKVLWEQFAQARVRGDWLPHDLVMLHKIVKIETQIREETRALRKEGSTELDNTGRSHPNARIKIIQQLHTQQMSLIRALHMNVTSSNTPHVRASAERVHGAKMVQKPLAEHELIAGHTVN